MKKYLLMLLITGVLLLFAGCITPQERCGVSPIPFNSPPPENSQPINGSF